MSCESKTLDWANPAEALILGLGASGRASAELLAARGWRVKGADTRTDAALAEALREAAPGAQASLGGFPLELLDGVSGVVLSPGLSPYFGPAAPLVRAAEARGLPVVGEIELFALELKRLEACTGYRPKVIGVTGTNGKTTTTALAAKMAAASGASAAAAGNIGPNASLELLKAERGGTLPDVWVLELSSFQLDRAPSLELDSAALLNVTEDHIDWHGSLEAYAAAKRRIFRKAAVRVLNRDDAWSRMSAAGADRVETFGAEPPAKPGEWGLMPAADGPTLARMRADGSIERLVAERDLLIRGRHNSMNALAALALVVSAGLPLEAALEALRVYGGEPHRVAWAGSIDGVDFIDDSKGTNVGAVAAAVQGFAAQGRPLLIILGGDGKGQDFAPLARALKGAARAAAVIGKDAEPIREALRDCGFPIERCATLESAVDWLWAKRRKGDVMLLSPACASWDMFRNYAERSERFVAKVRTLKADAPREGYES